MFTPERLDALARAEQLRIAAALVDEFAPNGDERQRSHKTDVLRRLGLLVAGLERHERHEICRRCRAEFVVRVSWFESRGLAVPRHCDSCRVARREERRRAGLLNNFPQR